MTTSATNNKYDRQLRLWGAAGQHALGETCAVLLRATAAGTETLKNLVLPGIGSFVVLDDVLATATDASSNFFVTASSSESNKNPPPRAQVACELLQELNPDVRGSYQHIPNGLLAGLDLIECLQKLSAGSKFLIIASDLEPPLLEKVAATCRSQAWPLLVVHSYGLLGVVRLQTPAAMALLQPRLRDTIPDLRLNSRSSSSSNQRFGRLQHVYENVHKFHLPATWEALDNAQHGHVPYPYILMRLADEWKAAHQGNLPKSLAEKQEFQQTIRKAARNYDMELNFQQAHSNAYLAYAAPRELNDDPSLLEDAPASFVALMQALRQFVAQTKRPPIAGNIPDMDASTELYVELQQVYQAQAADDWKALRALAPKNLVSDDDITHACQNVFALDVLRTGNLSVLPSLTTNVDPEVQEDLVMASMDDGEGRPEHIPLLWWLGFWACQQFAATYQRHPGTVDAEYERDIAVVQDLLEQTARAYGVFDSLVSGKSQDVAIEMTRYANAEIHTIASVVGGVASQEAVKVITGQYVPLDNTYVYNGIASTGAVYKV